MQINTDRMLVILAQCTADNKVLLFRESTHMNAVECKVLVNRIVLNTVLECAVRQTMREMVVENYTHMLGVCCLYISHSTCEARV